MSTQKIDNQELRIFLRARGPSKEWSLIIFQVYLVYTLSFSRPITAIPYHTQQDITSIRQADQEVPRLAGMHSQSGTSKGTSSGNYLSDTLIIQKAI